MSNDYHGKEVAMVPATLRGYRCWLIGATGHGAYVCHCGCTDYKSWPDTWDHLYACNFNDHAWDTGVNVAKCKTVGRNILVEQQRGLHPSPVNGCTCGIYATHTPTWMYTNGVRGVIEASGRILLGTKGFRAEKAQIVALATGHLYYTERLALKARWEPTGVMFYDSVDEMLEAFPPGNVYELIGDLLAEEEAERLAALEKHRQATIAFNEKLPAMTAGFEGAVADMEKAMSRMGKIWITPIKDDAPTYVGVVKDWVMKRSGEK